MGNIQEEEIEETKSKDFLHRTVPYRTVPYRRHPLGEASFRRGILKERHPLRIVSVTLTVLIVMALLVIGYLFISMKKLENEMIETSAFEVGDYPKKVTFSVEYDTEVVDLMIISPSGKTYEAGNYGVVYENTDYSMYDADSLDNENNDSDETDNINVGINNMDNSDDTESSSANLNSLNTDTTAATNTMSDADTNADTNADTDITEDNSINTTSTTSGVSELVDSYAEGSIADSTSNSASDNMNNTSDSTSDSITNMKGICSITITASEKGEWKVAYNKKSNGTLNPRVDVDFADGVYIYNVTLDTGDTNNTSSNTKNTEWKLTFSTMCGSVDELQIEVFAESNKVNKRCMLAEEVIDVNEEVTLDLDISNLITADDWKITIYTYDASNSFNSSYHISYKLTGKYSYEE